MFSDPQFWVAISFMLFIAAIFNPVRKTLTSSLDAQIKDIKNRIDEVEKIKSEAQKTLDELKERESKVENEIDNLKIDCEKKISELEKISGTHCVLLLAGVVLTGFPVPICFGLNVPVVGSIPQVLQYWSGVSQGPPGL